MEVFKTVTVLLLVTSTLPSCRADDVVSFSLGDPVNCQNLAVVKVTVNYFNEGTVCGTVDQTTADYICLSQIYRYGPALDYGHAVDKGVSGGSGTIEVTNLNCTSGGACTFSTDTAACSHSDDLVIQCSGQPYVCFYFPIGAIIGLALAGFFFCIFLPVIACIVCCVSACTGKACFASKTPNYSQL